MAELPDPEKIAESIVAKTGQKAPPVDLDRVVGLWPGLSISKEDLDKAGYIVDLGAQGAEIVVRNSDPDPRQRYTIAHEIGHWKLGRLNCQLSELAQEDRLAGAETERWCDKFAAAVLMPRPWVLRIFVGISRERLIETIRSEPSRFRVSHEAFRLRVSELTPISIAELKSGGADVDVRSMYPSGNVAKSILSGLSNEYRRWVGLTRRSAVVLDHERQLWVACSQHQGRNNQKGYLLCFFPVGELQGDSSDVVDPNERPSVDQYARLRVIAARQRKRKAANTDAPNV